MTASSPSQPLVAIVGATGTGKSQLAVELALRFNGEVINGDAMQLYDGLPIITNKVTSEERKGVPHHLLGRVRLDEEPWTVERFTRTALQVIREIRSRGRLPIVVGGTHYYTQSLLFKEPLAAASTVDERSEEHELSHQEIYARHPILNASTEVIWARLKEEDPVMAQRWHPNDRRRIQRSLEIYLLTGKRASDIYDEQRRAAGPPKMIQPELGSQPSPTSIAETLDISTETPAGRTLRSPTLILWTHAVADVLKPRLEERVHAMLRGGLLSEVELLDRQGRDEQGRGISTDTTRGIWVSIGYKEFLPFLTALTGAQVSTVELESIKNEAIRRTQTATWQYAKRQIRWIRIKLLHAVLDAGAKERIFVLGGDDESSDGFSSVIETAADLVHRFLVGAQLPAAASVSSLGAELLVPKQDDMSRNPELWVRKTCEVCETVTVTEHDWAQHLRSRGHRRATKRKKERPQRNSELATGESSTNRQFESCSA